MLPYEYLEDSTIIGAPHYHPSVSIIAPFHPVMYPKAELEQRLKAAVEKVEKELLAKYPIENALPVIGKLFHLVRTLNFNTHKKSIALFVSPVLEKVYYLDITVDEKIVVDDSFEIRDLVYSKKQNTRFLVLLLGSQRSMTYLGDQSALVLIKSNVPDNVTHFKGDPGERPSPLDAVAYKEVLLEKFLQQMDDGLSIILTGYNVPVFVLGPEKVLAIFKRLTRNAEKLATFIEGQFEDLSAAETLQVLQPYLSDWAAIKQQAILHELDVGMSKQKVIWGVDEVRRAAENNNSRLLVVEKSFIYPDGGDTAGMFHHRVKNPEAFYLKDAVDDIIEKVLQNGGDAEFVDNGKLEQYGRIALIKYY